MSTNSKKTPNTSLALEFKSSNFSVPVLALSSDDLITIEQQLQEKASVAPDFFKNLPVVIDLQASNKLECNIDIETLTAVIKKVGLLPIGIRGGNAQQNKQALNLLIPVYSVNHGVTTEEPQKQQTPAPTPETETRDTSTMLITQPIRSGQRIYATGDLIITAQVSSGAEIMAEGNIHVYNTLRGRASAGIQGNKDARIFCFDLQAELISIAGIYKVSEDIGASVRNKPVQIYLQNQALIIQDLLQHH
ncbi:MAG: septum site-determining protein MinC [Methylococcales bacterium]|jgi:septum site-determining protein MinC|nr:MAG: septum site-determining protein MinC [Methylococcales bacterium]